MRVLKMKDASIQDIVDAFQIKSVSSTIKSDMICIGHWKLKHDQSLLILDKNGDTVDLFDGDEPLCVFVEWFIKFLLPQMYNY